MNRSIKDHKLQMSVLFVFLNLICCGHNPKGVLTMVLYICIFLSMFIILLYVCIMHIMDFLEEQWKFLITLLDQYYPIFKVWSIFKPYVLIRHPDDLKVIKYK